MPRKKVALRKGAESEEDRKAAAWMMETIRAKLKLLQDGGLSEDVVEYVALYLACGVTHDEAVAILRDHPDAHRTFLKMRAGSLFHVDLVNLKLRVYDARKAGTT